MSQDINPKDDLEPVLVTPVEPNTEEPHQTIDTPNAEAITPLELLEAENLQLRLMNLSHQEADLMRQIRATGERREQLQKEMIAHRDNLAKKYNIDFAQYEVEAKTGKIHKRGA